MRSVVLVVALVASPLVVAAQTAAPVAVAAESAAASDPVEAPPPAAAATTTELPPPPEGGPDSAEREHDQGSTPQDAAPATLPAVAVPPAESAVAAPPGAHHCARDPGHGGKHHGGAGDGRFDLSFDGYLRVEGTSILPDRFLGIRMPASYARRSLPNVGRNDGFALGDARLNLRATYRDNLYVRLGFDGAVASYRDSSDTAGELSTGLKDAYLRYTFTPAASVFVGRFKPPFDVEELTPTADQFFVHRALESRGVERHEGPHGDLFGRSDVAGFAPGRQIGVMLGSDALVASTALKLGYALAMTNGNSGDAAYNDNDLPAFYGRAYLQVDGAAADTDEEGPATFRRPQGGLVGLSGFYNELSFGQAPNRYRDRVTGVGLDAAWSLMGFYLQGQLLAARTDAVSRRGLEPVYAFGGHVQLAVQVPRTGLFPGYRFALLDPRKVFGEVTRTADGATPAVGQSTDIDRVVLHTVGVRYQAAELPITGAVEYTHSVEQGGRAQPNDRVEAALQVSFQ